VPLIVRWRDAVLTDHGDSPERYLHPSERLVLLALAKHMAVHTGANCFPSTRRLAGETGLSRQGVRNALDRVEKLGWITRTRRSRETGGHTSTLYRPTWPMWLVNGAGAVGNSVAQVPEPDGAASEGTDVGGQLSGPGPGNSVAQGGQPNAPGVGNLLGHNSSVSRASSTPGEQATSLCVPEQMERTGSNNGGTTSVPANTAQPVQPTAGPNAHEQGQTLSACADALMRYHGADTLAELVRHLNADFYVMYLALQADRAGRVAPQTRDACDVVARAARSAGLPEPAIAPQPGTVRAPVVSVHEGVAERLLRAAQERGAPE